MALSSQKSTPVLVALLAVLVGYIGYTGAVIDNLGMQGAVFVDAGSLWDPSQQAVDAVRDEGSFILDTADVRLSTGFSLIWQSPLGPLRADFAQALLKASWDRTEFFRFGASTNF